MWQQGDAALWRKPSCDHFSTNAAAGQSPWAGSAQAPAEGQQQGAHGGNPMGAQEATLCPVSNTQTGLELSQEI